MLTLLCCTSNTSEAQPGIKVEVIAAAVVIATVGVLRKPYFVPRLLVGCLRVKEHKSLDQ